MLYNHLQKAMAPFKGRQLWTVEIIWLTRKLCSNTSIQPSDYCNNHHNKDPYSGKHQLFKRIKRGLYKVLDK